MKCIIIPIFALLIVIYLLRKGIIEGRKSEPSNGTIITHPDEEMFAENDYIDEFSPENIDLDKTLNILKLQNKLNQIEEENINENK